jgi:hypothetical protein
MKYNILLIGFAAALVLSGCTKDFDNINKNPNGAQEVDNPQFLLPAIIKNSVRNYSYTSEFTASVAGDYYANQYTSGFDDAWTPGQTEGAFLWNFYNQLRDVENMRILSHDKGFKNNEGVALVLRCWMFQVMTDNFGDLPYTEALQGKTNNNFSPAFDKQEVIYYALIDSLTTANTLLTSGQEAINADILLNGNAMRWREFANSLKLRLLMRISGKSGLKIDVAALMSAMVSDPTTYPLFGSYADQAALSYIEEQGNEFPAYYNNPINDYHLSTTLETNLNKLNDPRIKYYAQPTPASLVAGTPAYGGVPNGIGTAESSYGGGTNNQSQVSPVLQPASAFSQASKTAAQGMIITYSEVQFILAEARERGLITTGDAETYYLNGINDQFAYLASRLDVANFSYPKSSDIAPSPSYFTQPDVAYVGTTDEKLYKIRIQKWFALFYDGFEGWSEWRRTGVPKETAPGPNSATSVWPKRSRYPLSEQTINSTNYATALQQQGPDDLITPVWWNKN